jgi:hypothetical protein
MNRTVNVLFIFPFLSFTLSSQAQKDTNKLQRAGYLFEHFINGSVLLKSGGLEQAPLNYNAEKQGIAFEKGGQYLDLVGLETIDTVYVESKKFIPVNGIFYEMICNSPFELYATYTCKPLPVTATAEHDRTVRKENNQVSNTVSDVYVTRQYRGDYVMEFRKHYWLKRYRDFYKVNTEKQVIKLFPKREAAIRAYLSENKTGFNNEDDLVKLLRFCSTEQ